MEITLTDAKMETMKPCCREMLNETMLNAYYKYLEQDKRIALKESRGCFDTTMILSS